MEKKKIKFSDLDLFVKLAAIGGLLNAFLYIIYFFIGFFGALL